MAHGTSGRVMRRTRTDLKQKIVETLHKGQCNQRAALVCVWCVCVDQKSVPPLHFHTPSRSDRPLAVNCSTTVGYPRRSSPLLAYDPSV